MLQRILEGDEAAGISSPLATKKRKTRNSDVLEMFKTPRDFGDDFDTEEDSWADSSTLNDDDDLSLSRPSSLDRKENTRSKKIQKAGRKIARNQGRFKAVTVDDVGRINEALHPLVVRDPLDDGTNEHHNRPGLPNNATINANITFNSRTFQYSTLRPDIHNKKILKANATHNNKSPSPSPGSHESPLVTTMLRRLGISTLPLHPHKERKPLLARLRNLIATDLECVDNEDKETMMRMAGYWRFANRRTYNAMVRHNQLWDWETGAKLEEIEEGGDDGDDVDEGTISDQETAVASPPLVEDYAGDFELGAEMRVLRLLDREALPDDDDEIADEGKERGPLSATASEVPSLSAGIEDTENGIQGPSTTQDGLEATPTQATFSGIKDTRFRTTPTQSTFFTTPCTTAMLPNRTAPTRLTPAPSVPHHDPNNRFAALAATLPSPRSRPHAAGPVCKMPRVPARCLALTVPGKEGRGDEGGKWAEVVRKGRK